MDVSILVIRTDSGGERPHRTVLSPTNCGDIRLQYIMEWSAQGVTTAFRDSSDDEDDTLQTTN